MNKSTVDRLEQLFPPLKVKGYQLIQLMSLKSIDVEICQGLRTWPEQAALYAQGRTAPGPVVTRAKPEQSWHTFGCAFDVDIVTASGIDWTGTSPAWRAVIACGEEIKLTEGAEWRTFPDKPHFQLTGRFPRTPDQEVLYIFREAGIQAIWNEISKSLAA